MWKPNKLKVEYYGNGANYMSWGEVPLSSDFITSVEYLYDASIEPTFPADYMWEETFKLSKSWYEPTNLYHVWSATSTHTINQDLGKNTVIAVAEELWVLSSLKKQDTTVKLYAGWKQCTAWYYCPSNKGKTQCSAWSYCPAWSSSPTGCPGNMTSSAGSDEKNDCYITCSAGTYLSAYAWSCSSCEWGNYCEWWTYYYSSSTQGKSSCPSQYPESERWAKSINDCYAEVPENYNKYSLYWGVTACDDGTYAPSHRLYYWEISSDYGGYFSCHAVINDTDRHKALREKNRYWEVECSDWKSFDLYWDADNAWSWWQDNRKSNDLRWWCYAAEKNTKLFQYRQWESTKFPKCICSWKNCSSECLGDSDSHR